MINEKNRIMISNVMSKERITDTIRFVLFFHLNPIKTFFSKKLTLERIGKLMLCSKKLVNPQSMHFVLTFSLAKDKF